MAALEGQDVSYYNAVPQKAIYGGQPTKPQQDTLFSLIEQLEKQAFTARENAQAVADAVDGQPVDKNPAGINPSPSSAVEKLRMILYTLQAVNGEANRARRALGV